MAEYVLTATKTQARAGSFYDRIERAYDLTFKLNGYGKSLDQYFEQHPLPVSENARVLDAGCGTGTLTLALLRTLRVPVKLTAIDLSSSVISTARKYVGKENPNQQEVRFAQGNVMALPFADETFDVVVTSGVLEYLPLEEGFTGVGQGYRPRRLLFAPADAPGGGHPISGITLQVQDPSTRRTLRNHRSTLSSRQPLPLPAVSGYRLEQDRGAGAQNLGTQASDLLRPFIIRLKSAGKHAGGVRTVTSPAPTAGSDRHPRTPCHVHHDSSLKSK
jgi:SAM-dependent methyltransferase